MRSTNSRGRRAWWASLSAAERNAVRAKQRAARLASPYKPGHRGSVVKWEDESMLKAAAERVRLRAVEKISSDCSTSNLMVARADLMAVLGALDLADGIMPANILASAHSVKSARAQWLHAVADYATAPNEDAVERADKWKVRTIDAASKLADAVLAYEHTGASGAASGVSSGAAHVETRMTDQTAGGTQAAGDNEDNRRAQRAADRLVAARVEMAAAIQFANDERNDIDSDSKAAIAFLDATLNPTVPNPPPVAPDVAAPTPTEEPPVFTDVSTPEITPENTSGGFSPDIAASMPVEGFEEVVTDDAPAPPTDEPGSASGPA